MVAAVSMGPKGFEARLVRGGKAAQGYESSKESRKERAEAAQSARQLTEPEIAELVLYWAGGLSAGVLRSVQGAVEDRLLRAPPRLYVSERAICEAVQAAGYSAPRDKVIQTLVLEDVATRHEILRALQKLAREGLLEEREIPTAAGETATMLFLARDRDLPGKPPAERLSREERWQRADEELERFCLGGPQCGDSAATTARLPPMGAQRYREDNAAFVALSRLSPLERRTLERAYGMGAPPERDLRAAFGPLLARLVVLTPAAERARQELVARRAKWIKDKQAAGLEAFERRARGAEKGAGELEEIERALAEAKDGRERMRLHLRKRALEREVAQVSRLRLALEQDRRSAPEADWVADGQTTTEEALGEMLSARTPKARRAAFVSKAKAESAEMLARACLSYRTARSI